MIPVSDFPLTAGKQLFHVPGLAAEGGFTSGGARIMSPEPGGRAVLEFEPALLTKEWDAPLASWIMSKLNGHVFRVPLARTPQLVTLASLRKPERDAWGTTRDIWKAPDTPDPVTARYIAASLEGSNLVVFDVSRIGPIVRPGHVIGHADNAYLIDSISYVDGTATAIVTPPLRRNVAANDMLLFRPYFTGSIVNGDSIRNTYDAENVGNIQIGKIIFNEVILP